MEISSNDSTADAGLAHSDITTGEPPKKIWKAERSQLRSGIQRRLHNRRFWRDSSLLMLSNVIVMALGLIRVPVLTRALTKDEIGMIGVVASILPFLQLFSLSGLDGATYHYVAKGYPAAVRVNIATRFRWSTLSTLGFLVGGVYWHRVGNPTLAGLFTIAALTYPVTAGLTTVAGVLAAREDFLRLFWYRIGEASTRYVGFGMILLLPLLSSQVLWFSLANQLALAILQVGVAVWLIKQLQQDPQPMPAQERREMVRYGRHLTVLNSISTAQTRVDALLVGWFLPLGVMADYSIAQLVYAQFKQLWVVYYSIRYPPLVRLPLIRRRRRLVLETSVVWVGFILLGLTAGAAIWLLVPIILPQEYSSSLSFMFWLIAAFVASVPGFFAEMYFRTRQDERSQYWLRGTAAISGVILPALFILFWQARGAVIGRFVASLVLSICGGLLFFKEKVENDESPVFSS